MYGGWMGCGKDGYDCVVVGRVACDFVHSVVRMCMIVWWVGRVGWWFLCSGVYLGECQWCGMGIDV